MDLIERDLHEELAHLFDDQSGNIQKAARGLKVIAHPARLKILCVLSKGEYSVQALEKYTGLAQATLSQHLSVLKDRDVVNSRRDGNFSLYSIGNPQFIELFHLIKGMYCQP
ncbi:MAG: winged helix-turn-helix transcriptional regulator [SAR324 cluster bacterium]|nr:winged helix-turn-helix transcriptional regulator [SAR324 cluster bacterium]